MSRDVFSIGWIAELETPLGKEALRDEVQEELWSLDSPVGLNYEGTLLVVDLYHNQKLRYDSTYPFTIDGVLVEVKNKTLASVDPRDNTSLEEVVNALPQKLADLLRYKPNRAFGFTETWYSGVDSYHASLTLEQFRSRFS